MKHLFIFILLFFVANNSFAQDVSLTEELGSYTLNDLEQIIFKDDLQVDEEIKSRAKIYILFEKQTVPVNGLLLNPEALSMILSKHMALIEKTNLALETQRKSDLAKLNLETDRLKLELDAFRKKSEINIKGRDAEIKNLQETNKKILEDRSHIRRKIFIGLGSSTGGLVLGYILSLIFH